MNDDFPDFFDSANLIVKQFQLTNTVFLQVLTVKLNASEINVDWDRIDKSRIATDELGVYHDDGKVSSDRSVDRFDDHKKSDDERKRSAERSDDLKRSVGEMGDLKRSVDRNDDSKKSVSKIPKYIGPSSFTISPPSMFPFSSKILIGVEEELSQCKFILNRFA